MPQLHPDAIVMAPTAAHPAGTGRRFVDIMAAVNAEKKRSAPPTTPRPAGEPSMHIEIAALKPQTLQALIDDRAIPEEMKKLAKEALKKSAAAPDPEEPASDEAVIAASHRAGGISAFIDRQLAKSR